MKTTLLSTICLASNAMAMLPVFTKGDRFVKQLSSADEVFYIKGVDYQPGGSSGYDPASTTDVLSDPNTCLRDAYVLQQLGVNTIRIYTVNPNVNHDECMTILNNAGIYVLLDVNSGAYMESLNRADPASTYNAQYLSRVFKMVEAFKNYPNVIGFFSGNEVINDDNNYAQIDPMYVRAVIRDMKAYIAKHSPRDIPVGYSAADNTQLAAATFEYLQCSAPGADSAADFFGLNSYSWCGDATWSSSGYDKLNSTYSDATIPVFFSEYGCNNPSPRDFSEVSQGLYSGLLNTFSGGLVYEYSQEPSNYGLVQIDSSGNIQYLQDFANLQKQYSGLSLPTTGSSDIKNSTSPTCDASKITGIESDFGANFTLPTDSGIQSMIDNGVSHNNTGSLLSTYSPNLSVPFTIVDASSNTITDASVVWASSNMINPSFTGSASTATAQTTSSSANSTSSKSSKSKGAAATTGGSLLAVAALAVGFLL